MFGALVFDKDPLTLADIPAGVLIWFQVVGGFSFLAALLWLLLGYPRLRPQDRDRIPRWQKGFFLATFLLGVAAYVLAGVFGLVALARAPGDRAGQFALNAYNNTLALGGLFFVLAVGLPFAQGLTKLSWRRIAALAKLSFKEALRRRVLYAFAGFILVFLFATWFLFDTKPEDEVRTYVGLVFFVMAVLLLPAAALVSAFSLPADIKQQTIHTIVTKPVERFEIILGRFLGFLALMTLVLLALTGVSLLYVLRGVHPEAAAESVKARDALYGVLRFENTDSERAGVNVGREWDYRSYITAPAPGQEKNPQTARWDFERIPAALAGRDNVHFEYTFDIYRTTKGDKEGTGVTCEVQFFTWRYRPGNDVLFRKERGDVRDPARDSALAEKYGYFEIPGLPVTDYHTQEFLVPGGLFKNIHTADPDAEKDLERTGQARPADLIVRFTCKSATQYVGMARHDLYVRLDDPTGGAETLGFALNFFKAAFGLWLLMALVIGLSVVLSSHLSGVITLLVVATLFFCGLGREFIQNVAVNAGATGGPAEAMLRIFRRELSGPRLDESQSTADRLVFYSDDTFRWVLRRILLVFPDVNEFFLTRYVAEGFNIAWGQMGLDLLILVGYLLPCFVLAYYLIRWREIAAST